MREYQILGRDFRITFSALTYYIEQGEYLFVNGAFDEILSIPTWWEIQIVENNKIVIDNRLKL